MRQNKPNNSVDQFFVGVGVNKSVTLSRPRHAGAIVKTVLVLLFATLLFAIGYWYQTRPRTILLPQLPVTTEWYASLSLPPTDTWYGSLLFWKTKTVREQNIQRLYQKLNLFSVHNASFGTELLPYSSGTLEMAQLAAQDMVFATRLSQPAAWFTAMDTNPSTYEQTIEPMTTSFTGWFAQQSDTTKWFWLVDGDILYITSSMEVAEVLQQPKETTLRTIVSRSRHNRGLLYIASHTVLERSPQKELAFLGTQIDYPITLFVEQHGENAIHITTNTTQSFPHGSNETIPLLQKIVHLSDGTISMYSKTTAQFYERWHEQVKATNLNAWLGIEALETQVTALYGATIRQPMYENPSAFMLYKNESDDMQPHDWLFIVQDISNTFGTSTEASLQEVGIAVFAQSHPVERTVLLTDGTQMVERRAETDGLVWQESMFTVNGIDIPVSELRGTGELTGMMTGTIEGVGVFITNAPERIRIILAQQEQYALYDSKDDPCMIVQESFAELQFAGSVLSDDSLVQEVIGSVFVQESASGHVRACVRTQ